MNIIQRKKTYTNVIRFEKNRIQCLRIVYARKSFKIGELLVEQLRYTEFRITKFLISLSRQIESFLRFWLES